MRIGKSSIQFTKAFCHDSGIVVGPKEKSGPLSKYFDIAINDLHYDEKSWEKAEMKMLDFSIKKCLEKNMINENKVDLFIHGDLNNQLVIGNYCLRNHDISTLGVFSACSSFTEGLLVAGQFLEGKTFDNILVGVSSHNASAEKQFRYPLEYGGQKPECTTYTVTAATTVLVSSNPSSIRLAKATIGKIEDNKLKDCNDMGRAMAIAAYSTFKQHFQDFKIDYSYYDLILTGDLSLYGKRLFEKYLLEDGIVLNNYNDSGLMMYDTYDKTVFAGGSGCGCVSAVTTGFIFDKLKKKELKKVLILATGALLNPIMIAQKETIPSVCHAISLEVE